MKSFTKLNITFYLCLLIPFVVFAHSGEHQANIKLGGQNWGGITAQDNTAYVGSDDGKLYAIDLKNHKIIWAFPTTGKVRSKPLLDGQAVLFSSDDGHLYSLDRKSALVNWQTNLNDRQVARQLPEDKSPWSFDYTKSSPVVSNNTIFVGSADNHLYAINKTTGKVEWRFETNSMIRGIATLDEQNVYIGSWQGTVYAIDKKTGQLNWQFASKGIISSSPSLYNQTLIISSRDTYIYGLNKDTGKVKWQIVMPDGSWVESSAVVDNSAGTFYIGSSDAKKLYKIDAQTGAIIWQTSLSGWAWGKPVMSEHYVFIGATGHDHTGWFKTQRGFYALDKTTGKIAWQYQPSKITGFVHGGVYAEPAIANNKVVVPDLDGHIHIFEL
ncbi:hypothetical protein CWB73_05310 [Pseudoalteromonas phenolica]|uniref:Pyrrolo-quinoline quinone repeat domain-containing protein n=1 Tax=Pseudoalteromonas phenolica TaxID=161398 RepID=A0A5S3YWX3_9GAMM|nr:PQQ-binding-like beta-propeller repeat protein [Pseudoalteromonas phenolica]TMN92887.1 hypothetical protein CWB72_03925 [Pseudoalteromonas phenolica]TMP82308.1 hypothetical protein CWB73_05310 [Pseudoalteromonas phenolica]